MSDGIRFIASTLLCGLGLFIIITSVFGVFRFRFVLNRMHCAANIDTLGALLLLAGLMIAAGTSEYILKMIGILAFLWIGSPVASHLVARIELLTDKEAPLHMEHPEEMEDNPDGIL